MLCATLPIVGTVVWQALPKGRPALRADCNREQHQELVVDLLAQLATTLVREADRMPAVFSLLCRLCAMRQECTTECPDLGTLIYPSSQRRARSNLFRQCT